VAAGAEHAAKTMLKAIRIVTINVVFFILYSPLYLTY